MWRAADADGVGRERGKEEEKDLVMECGVRWRGLPFMSLISVPIRCHLSFSLLAILPVYASRGLIMADGEAAARHGGGGPSDRAAAARCESDIADRKAARAGSREGRTLGSKFSIPTICFHAKALNHVTFGSLSVSP